MPRTVVGLRTSKRISASAVHALFQRMQWHDWFTLEDVRWYLDQALYVASAWDARRCVGVAVLDGDGRINTRLDTIVVDEAYQGRGIGTALVKKIMARVARLRPYYMQLDVYQKRTQRWYMQFGFVRNKGTWLLEHKPTADRLRARVRAIRGR
jgi:GNAT superfamily N-acetyltransferase